MDAGAAYTGGLTTQVGWLAASYWRFLPAFIEWTKWTLAMACHDDSTKHWRYYCCCCCIWYTDRYMIDILRLSWQCTCSVDTQLRVITLCRLRNTNRVVTRNYYVSTERLSLLPDHTVAREAGEGSSACVYNIGWGALWSTVYAPLAPLSTIDLYVIWEYSSTQTLLHRPTSNGVSLLRHIRHPVA